MDNTKMYVAQITRTTGDYESTFRKLAYGADVGTATANALAGECHGECDADSEYFDPETDVLYGYAYMNDGNFWVNSDTIAECHLLYEVPEALCGSAKILFEAVAI